MDTGLGQQTYGHPHHVTTGWMPHHMLSADQNMSSQPQAHHVFTISQQPLPPIYYDIDQSQLQHPVNVSSHLQLSEQHQSAGQQPLTDSASQHHMQPTSTVVTDSESPYTSTHTKTFSSTEEDTQNLVDDSTSKNHTTPMTLKWLNDNYEVAEGVCIPRSTLYQHYIEFCESHELNPVNAASFGKIIRQQFPQITTRRLGTRGQSKYHYYGIGVKEQSQYYDLVYSKAGLQCSNATKKETPKQTPVQAYSPRSKMGTLLPDFPNIDELKLPKEIESDKLLTFVMMYRTHCQRILDTVIRANFDEVQNFLLHFWQGMPSHMTAILGASQIVGMVAVCDTILYKAICSVLMPHVLQPLPESLTMVIKKFAKQLEEWIAIALNDLPDSLRQMKLNMAKKFSRILRLQMSLNHLCQASRSVVSSSDVMSQMLDDWQAIDRKNIIKQTRLTLCHKDMVTELDKINQFYDEFEQLLHDSVSIELFVEWLDKIIDEIIVKTYDKTTGNIKRKSRNFLLVWSAFSTKIIRDMTLHSAPSFGSFHLLHLMFDDYILYQLEHMCCTELSDEILSEIKKSPESSCVITETCSTTSGQQKAATGQEQLQNTLSQCTTATSDSAPITIQQHEEEQRQQTQTEFMTSSHVELLSHFTNTVRKERMEEQNRSDGNTTLSQPITTSLAKLASASCANTSSVHSTQIPTHSHNNELSVSGTGTHMGAHHVSTEHNNGYQSSSIAYYMNDLGNNDASWRLQDSIPPPPLQYHGETYNMQTEPSNPDILYYAVNSLNLLPETVTTQCTPSTTATTTDSQNSRVTFDPEEVQQALERSFQPFTQHLQYVENAADKETTKRAACSEHADLSLSKRFRPDDGSTIGVKDNYVIV